MSQLPIPDMLNFKETFFIGKDSGWGYGCVHICILFVDATLV